jgi:hypothetical protein
MASYAVIAQQIHQELRRCEKEAVEQTTSRAAP